MGFLIGSGPRLPKNCIVCGSKEGLEEFVFHGVKKRDPQADTRILIPKVVYDRNPEEAIRVATSARLEESISAEIRVPSLIESKGKICSGCISERQRAEQEKLEKRSKWSKPVGKSILAVLVVISIVTTIIDTVSSIFLWFVTVSFFMFMHNSRYAAVDKNTIGFAEVQKEHSRLLKYIYEYKPGAAPR